MADGVQVSEAPTMNNEDEDPTLTALKALKDQVKSLADLHSQSVENDRALQQELATQQDAVVKRLNQLEQQPAPSTVKVTLAQWMAFYDDLVTKIKWKRILIDGILVWEILKYDKSAADSSPDSILEIIQRLFSVMGAGA